MKCRREKKSLHWVDTRGLGWTQGKGECGACILYPYMKIEK
jgi:hypothetical protein